MAEAVVPSSPMTEPSVLAPAAPSNEDLASAAARRRQRILDQGNSRMNRIMGGHRSSSQDTRKVEQATSTPFNYNTVSSEAVASVDNVVAASPDNAATDVTISATVPSPSPLSTSSSEATATKAKSECAIEPPPSRAPSTVTLPLPSKVATAYPQVRPTIALSRGMKLVVLCLTALLVRLSGNPDMTLLAYVLAEALFKIWGERPSSAMEHVQILFQSAAFYLCCVLFFDVYL